MCRCALLRGFVRVLCTPNGLGERGLVSALVFNCIPPLQMLQKLLSSKNPDDLRAANRLIREMVRRDEKRMQKLQKRMEDVELIQNNVKLLNELLTHMQNDSGEQERLLVEVG